MWLGGCKNSGNISTPLIYKEINVKPQYDHKGPETASLTYT